MRRRSFGVVLVALILAAPAAWGATTTFRVGASCLQDCGAAGIREGDLVIGRIEISTDGFAPAGAITRADLVDFEIDFGETSTGVEKALSPGYGFSATWGAAANAIEAVSFVASGSSGLTSGGPFLAFGPAANLISIRGSCDDVDCADTDIEGVPAVLGPVSYTGPDIAPVPLPATGPLAVAGGIAIAAAAWRRRRPRAA